MPARGVGLHLWFRSIESGLWPLRDGSRISDTDQARPDAPKGQPPMVRWAPGISRRTSATPSCRMPSRVAAAGERSMIRPRTNGPRSSMRTITERPVSRSVTRTRVPNGRLRCAAIRLRDVSRSPSAVRCSAGQYHDARPTCIQDAGPVATGWPVAQAPSRSRRIKQTQFRSIPQQNSESRRIRGTASRRLARTRHVWVMPTSRHNRPPAGQLRRQGGGPGMLGITRHYVSQATLAAVH